MARMPLALGCALLVLSAFSASPARAQIMLIGDALPLCSSMHPERCRDVPDWPEQAMTESRYRIERSRIVRWALDQELKMDRADIDRWTQSLLSLVEDDPSDLSTAEFVSAIARAQLESQDRVASGRAEDFWAGIDPAVRHGLLDFFQAPQPEHHPLISLEHSADRAAVAALTRFVELASRVGADRRPLIAVSTAAARDPYADLPCLRQAFEQAGADVVWLPLDAAVRRARSEENCLDLARYQALELGSHDRRRHAPGSFTEQLVFCLDRNAGLEMVASIDGLFLDDGDADRLAMAFRNASGHATAELEVLRRRLGDRNLVVGGAGMGAVVLATDRLGLTPFNEFLTANTRPRDRALLAQRMVQRQARFGLGIDESSSLIVETLPDRPGYRLEADGHSGIWLLDQGPEPDADPSDAAGKAVVMRWLAAGESMLFDPDTGLFAEPLVLPTYEDRNCRSLDETTASRVLRRSSPEVPGDAISCYRQALAGDGKADWLLGTRAGSAGSAADLVLVIRAGSVVTTTAPDRDQ